MYKVLQETDVKTDSNMRDNLSIYFLKFFSLPPLRYSCHSNSLRFISWIFSLAAEFQFSTYRNWIYSVVQRVPTYIYSTEYCRKMFPIFHCNWNIVATFLLNIEQYFIATLQFHFYIRIFSFVYNSWSLFGVSWGSY